MGFVEAGWSSQRVADHFHVSRRTVTNLLRRYRDTGDVKDRPRSGRPKATDAREDRRIRLLALRQRTRSGPSIRNQIRTERRAGHQGLCVQTVRNRLRQYGLRSRKPAKKPRMNDGHRQARFQWARAHRAWTRAQWRDILFTDESRFCLDHTDGRRRVWRRNGERFQDCCVQAARQGRGGSIMVWGGISDQGKTDLIVVEGNMTGQRYIDQILRPVIVPYARNHGPHFQLMDDNARPHRANIVTNFLAAEHINRFLPWPAISPDMNPLEHCWDQLGRAVNERVQPGDTLADLRRYVMEEWLNIPQVRVHNLIRSTRRRCVALCVSRGGYTRY